MTARQRVGVALRVPVDEAFCYTVPAQLRSAISVGHAVVVPFGRRTTSGVVVEVDPPAPPGVELRDVRGLVLDTPVLDGEDLSLLRWMSRYYRHPLGLVVAAALPPRLRQLGRSGDSRPAAVVRTVEVATLTSSATAAVSAFSRPGPVRDRLIDYLERFGEVEVPDLAAQFSGARRILDQLQQRGLVALDRRLPSPLSALEPPPDVPASAPTLTSEQAAAAAAIGETLRSGSYATHLLYGVTGSGKTEVYLRAASSALEAGGGVLVLVPEIALTPQLVRRFARRLDVPLAVLHSGITPNQRLERWRALREGAARVAIGARSAVFAPVRDLRLVVVDEEHDGSFKQEEGLRYHARDVAVKRASLVGATCVLGSATPSLESLHNADEGRYIELAISTRVHARPMPDVTVVDLRQERGGPGETSRLLTPTLVQAVEDVVRRDEQAILLLNRRGHSTVVICSSCGGSFQCPDCDVALTYHGRRNVLLCHYCGRAVHRPDRCPHCQAAALEEFGEGTERVEEGLADRIAGLRVDRMDRDTTSDRGAHERILGRFRRGEIQVLVGTQMVAKGHDFPRVTLVGVLHADAALHLPDFRSGERTFALLTQVAGRAGRGEVPGRVIVQTFSPEHAAVRHALAHDYDGYARKLLRSRRALGYPPFGRLALVRLSHPQNGSVRGTARQLGDELRRVLHHRRGASDGLRLLGPSPAPMPRIAGRYRWHLLLLAPDPRTLAVVLDGADGALRRAGRISGMRVAVDVDPQSLM